MCVLVVHLNFCPTGPVKDDKNTLTETDKAGIERTKWFTTEDYAYVLEHAHRSSTISIVLASNPVALLAWYDVCFKSKFAL